jgi:hypothetical protein
MIITANQLDYSRNPYPNQSETKAPFLPGKSRISGAVNLKSDTLFTFLRCQACLGLFFCFF